MEELTTANPEWFRAKKPEDVIARPPDTPEGRQLVDYVGRVKISQGPFAGKRFCEVALPWQNRVLMWAPHVREMFVKIGKGSGKSAFCGFLALGHAMLSTALKKHHRGLIVVVASGIDSARITFEHTRHAILSDPPLSRVWKANEKYRTLTHRDSQIVIQILPTSERRAVGTRPHLLIVDELHVAARVADFDKVLTQLTMGAGNWPDHLIISISTSPMDPGQGHYVDLLNKARNVRDGKQKDNDFLPALYEYPVNERPDLDPFTMPETWSIFGMPSLITDHSNGRGTMSLEQMQSELEKAAADSELGGTKDIKMIMSQRLGIEPEDRVSRDSVSLGSEWPEANTDHIPPNPDRLFWGFDPSGGASDCFAVAIVYEYREQDLTVADIRQFNTFRAYADSPDFLKKIYDEAVEAGELVLCDSDRDMEQASHELVRSLQHHESIYGGDPGGMPGFPERFQRLFWSYEAVQQGFTLGATLTEVCIPALRAGRFKHISGPLMTFNTQNVRMTERGILRKPDTGTGKESPYKIDGVSALMSALYLQQIAPPPIDIAAMIG